MLLLTHWSMASPNTKSSPLKASPMKASFTSTNKRLKQIEKEMKEWRAEMEKEKAVLFKSWADEKEELKAEVNMLKGQVSALQQQMAEIKTSRGLEEGEFQPSMIEELKDIKEQVRAIQEEEKTKTSSWVEVITKTQKKADEAEKWIAVAKKGKDKEVATPTPTIINMTLEEEQRRRTRALHVRVTGLKDQDNVEEEVKELTRMMGITTPTHTKAWRVGKRGGAKGETSKERALILRFPSIEVKKEFLKKRPTLKKSGIFLGDDLTLSQLAHMQEVMPEIKAAREKGKIAFYREGRVVILEPRSS